MGRVPGFDLTHHRCRGAEEKECDGAGEGAGAWRRGVGAHRTVQRGRSDMVGPCSVGRAGLTRPVAPEWVPHPLNIIASSLSSI